MRVRIVDGISGKRWKPSVVMIFEMDRWFPLETERLFLREPTGDDEADVHEYASDPEVSRFESWGPNTPEATHEVIESWLKQREQWPREEVNLAVELKSQHKLIGVVTLRIKDTASRTADLGFAFNRRYWNQGYATEATSAIVDVAFRSLGLRRVWAGCDTRNAGSYHVMEKLGMRREGKFHKEVLQKGEWRDSYRYVVLEEEWRG
jgi:ribosomal-protein-alanine N-acetyltransferase